MTEQTVRSGDSIEQRIGRHLLVVGLLAALVLFPALHLGIRHLTEAYMLTRLQHDAESLVAMLAPTADGGVQLRPGALPTIYDRAASGHYFVLRGEGRELRSASLSGVELPPLPEPGNANGSAQIEYRGQHWLTWHRPLRLGAGDYQLWVAEDVSPFRLHQLRFELAVLFMALVFFAVIALTQRRVLRRAFALLEPVHEALAARRRGDETAFPQEVPQEVAPLVRTVRELLVHQDEQLRRSRTATGNLAHELKRPLQHLLDIASRHDDAQLRRTYDTLHQRIQRELQRARIAGSPTPGRLFLPRRDVPDLVDAIRRVTPIPRKFNAELPEGALPLDSDDTLELLGNLLDNAWRHARERVRLTVESQGGACLLRVEDDGPGVSQEDLPRLIRRGERLDEGGTGHGLGLALCQAIVDSYGGSLRFDASPLGGLCAEACFPRRDLS